MNQPSKAIAMNIISPMSRLSSILKCIVYWVVRVLLPSSLDTLLKLSFIHFARWVIIPRRSFPRLDPTQPKETLKYDYLLFCSNFNGDWGQYLDAFSAVLSDGLNSMWRGCLNWEDASYVTRLKRYVRWHQIRRGFEPTHYYYSAYPSATTNDVKAALHLYDEINQFHAASKSLPPDQFAAEFDRLLSRTQTDLGSTGPPMVDAGALAAAHQFSDNPTPPPFSNGFVTNAQPAALQTPAA